MGGHEGIRGGGAGDASALLDVLEQLQYESITRRLCCDRVWRLRVGLIVPRQWMAWLVGCCLRAVSELGCVFVAVPPQRCSVSRPARRARPARA